MSFDEPIERRGTGCAKWDQMTEKYGVPAGEGLAMWVADTEFRAPDCILNALQARIDHGIFGYGGDTASYRRAAAWWQRTRRGVTVDPDHILNTHGLVNAVALALDAYTAPGDAVILFTPVYHAFARVIRAAGREVRECPLAIRADGRFVMDLDACEAGMNGHERMVILCSPHNPGGRVWDAGEIAALGRLAARHGLVFLSDEVHADIVFPNASFVAAAAVPEAGPVVTLTSASKTFNVAGAGLGEVIVADEGLRNRFKGRIAAQAITPDIFAVAMAEAAYSPEGAAWVDDLVAYLDGNRRAFADGLADVPGLTMMPLDSTYLAWVDFAGTGLPPERAFAQVEEEARIAASRGPTFGTGGESFLRFNLGMRRAQVEEAARRLAAIFGGP